MSAPHVAHGPKSDIVSRIKERKIPKNCLIITKVEDPYEQEELFYYDNNRSLHPISTKTIFKSVEEAREWTAAYYKVGSVIAVKEDDRYHVYVVVEGGDLILIDGSDKVDVITNADESVTIGGSPTEPSIAVAIDKDHSGGLKLGDDGLYVAEVSDEESGAMTSVQKQKLDGIEPGAEVNKIYTIEPGSEQGTIAVDGVDIKITGLGSAAFTDKTEYQPIGTGMSYAVVESLPEEGRTDTIYLTVNKGEENNVFDEWLYVDGKFELVGTTKTDLSDYYTKEDVDAIEQAAKSYADAKDNIVRGEVAESLKGYTKASELAKVATTGSYTDLSNKPLFPVIVEPVKRSNGSYYGSITYYRAMEILKAGLPLGVHWEPNNMVYYCTAWNETRNYLTFSVQSYATNNVLRWDKATDKIEESAVTIMSTKDSVDEVRDSVTGLNSTVGGLTTSVAEIADDITAIETTMSGLADVGSAGNRIELEMDSTNYVVTAKLYNKNNELISTSSPIDLPIESFVIGAEYTDKKIVVTLKNGSTIDVPIGDMVDGLVSSEELSAYADVEDETLVIGGI